MANLKFRIYLRRERMLLELHNIARTPTGLYFNPTSHALGKTISKSKGSSSYHEDGNRWSKGLLERDSMKIKDRPLTDYSGQFTLSIGLYTILSPDGGIPELKAPGRYEDIIFERSGPFGIEIMISDKAIPLPPLPDRENSVVYVKDQVSPVIIVEVFDRPSAVMPFSRFPRETPLVEGETLFFDHPQRI